VSSYIDGAKTRAPYDVTVCMPGYSGLEQCVMSVASCAWCGEPISYRGVAFCPCRRGWREPLAVPNGTPGAAGPARVERLSEGSSAEYHAARRPHRVGDRADGRDVRLYWYHWIGESCSEMKREIADPEVDRSGVHWSCSCRSTISFGSMCLLEFRTTRRCASGRRGASSCG